MTTDEMKAREAAAEALFRRTWESMPVAAGDAPEWDPMSVGAVDMLRDASAAIDAYLAALSPVPNARVVPRPFDSDCATGVCAHKCSHLMWECKACTSEGGWGAPREKLELMAAEHVCVTLSSHPDEETVTTVAELDALPLGAVLAPDSTPTRAEVIVGQGDGWGTRFGVLSSTEVVEAMGPLRVLFRPTPEGSETAPVPADGEESQ